MRNLVPVFGDKPRVRLLEALLSLAPHEFTRGELAGDAGLVRRSGNRVFPELEDLNLVRQVQGGAHPTYAVNKGSHVFQVLQYLDHALGLALEMDKEPDVQGGVAEDFRARVAKALFNDVQTARQVVVKMAPHEEPMANNAER